MLALDLTSSAPCPRARDSVYNNGELRCVSKLGKMATELEKSDDALRAALIVAGRHIRTGVFEIARQGRQLLYFVSQKWYKHLYFHA